MGGPIVRTGTTPEFWKNWDQVFGDKPKTAKKKTNKTKTKTAVKSSKKKASKSKASKKKVKKRTRMNWKTVKPGRTLPMARAVCLCPTSSITSRSLNESLLEKTVSYCGPCGR